MNNISFISADRVETKLVEQGKKSIRIIDGTANMASVSHIVSFLGIDLSGYIAYKIRRQALEKVNNLIDFSLSHEPQTTEEVRHRKKMFTDLFKKLASLLRMDRLFQTRFIHKDRILGEGDAALKRLEDLIDSYKTSIDEETIRSVRESKKKVAQGKTVSAKDFLYSLNVHG